MQLIASLSPIGASLPEEQAVSAESLPSSAVAVLWERSTVSDAYDVQAWPELIGQIYEALEPIREFSGSGVPA